MKKMMTFGFALVAAFCALSTFAALETWVDTTTGLKWTYMSKTGPATIQGGDYQDWTATICKVESLNTNGWMATEFKIPAYINNYRVTAVYATILCNEFLTNVAPEKVTIPENAVVMAFASARDASEENFGLQHRTWYTNDLAKTGVVMFQDYLLTATNGVVTIPSNCTVIVNTSIMNPETTNIVWGADCQVETIENKAFAYAEKLVSLTIPDSVTTLGSRFYSYESVLPCYLETLKIGTGLKELPPSFDMEISTLADVDFGSNTAITTIPKKLFNGAFVLTNIVFGANVTTIKEEAFYCCTGLTKIDLSNTQITTIEAKAFLGCNNLTEVILPETIETIGAEAFEECHKLAKINFPSSLWSIGDSAFKNTALKNIDLSETRLYGINESVFQGVGTVTNVVFNDEYLAEIYAYAFYGCTNLTEITLPASLTKIRSKAFGVDAVEGVTNGVAKINFDGELTKLADNAFLNTKYYFAQRAGDDFAILSLGGVAYGWKGTPGKEITIGSDITVINDSVFASPKEEMNALSNVTKVVFGASVKTIGNNAFEYLYNLVDVDFSQATALESIGKRAFAFGAIKAINITANQVNLGGEAFRNCRNLETVKIGGLDGYVGSYAFLNCSSLKTVDFGEGAIGLNKGCFEACENLTSANMVLGFVGDNAFNVCSNLTSIALADDVTVKTAAFSGCTNLTTVTCEGTPKYVFSNAFDLDSPFMADDIVQLGGMIVKAANITNDVYTTPAGVTRFAQGAYLNCAINKVILSEEVESVPDSAFSAAGVKLVVLTSDNVRIFEGAFSYKLSEISYSAEKVGYNFTGFAGPYWDNYDYYYYVPQFEKVTFRTDPTQPTATDTDFTGNETYTGWLKDGSSIVGQITVKAGKVNAKTGKVKLTTTINFLGGKKTYTETVGLTTNAYGFVTAATTRRSVDGIELSGDWLTGSITLDGVNYTLEGGSDVTTTDKTYFKDYVGTWNLVFQAKSSGTGSGTVNANRIALTQGSSIVQVKIDKNGKVKATGTLADGTKVSATSKLVAGDNEANCASIMFVAYGNYQRQCTGKGGFGFLIWTYLDKDGTPVLYVKNDDVGSLSSCGNWIFPVTTGQEPWVYIPMSCTEAGAFVKGDNLKDGQEFCFNGLYYANWWDTFFSAVDHCLAWSSTPIVYVWYDEAKCLDDCSTVTVDEKTGKWSLGSKGATSYSWLKANTKAETLAKYDSSSENWNGKYLNPVECPYQDNTWTVRDASGLELLGYIVRDFGFKKVNGAYDRSTITKGNANNLKFSYNKNTGLYTGSYVIPWIKSTGVSTPQLKKTTVYINGAVIDGKGYGNCLIKKVGSFQSDIGVGLYLW